MQVTAMNKSLKPQPDVASGVSAEAEEDDYMNMTFAEPDASKFETTLQRRARKQREAEIKPQKKSKAEQAAEEAATREAALKMSIESTNKGFKMMQKLGFKGGALGRARGEDEPQARTEPISLSTKEDRGGIGMDSEKKRKIREQMEGEVKRVKAEEGDYRDRLIREKQQKRLEGQIIGAMNVAERLDEADESHEDPAEPSQQSGITGGEDSTVKIPPTNATKSKPLNKVNLLWRANVRHRLEKERERRIRYDLVQSYSCNPAYDDPDEDDVDKQALGREEEEIEEEDAELEEFLSLEAEVRLSKLVEYLRTRFHYCFWCKYRYPDASMDGCPGTTEEDHD